MKTYSRVAYLAAAVMAFGGLFGLAAHAAETEEIKIELPKPFFGGTPLDYFGPNLEPPNFKEPGPLVVPRGTANVALNKPVTSSKEPNFGKLSLIVDGDKAYEEKALTEVGPGLQWVQIDLEQDHHIHAIMLWHYHAAERVYFDTVVQVSSDPDFKEGVTTVFNNDHDNSAGLGAGKDKEYVESYRGRLIEPENPVTGRYVRLYSKGNTSDDMNHYVEVEVYGIPAG
jgi:hypothetical protein